MKSFMYAKLVKQALKLKANTELERQLAFERQVGISQQFGHQDGVDRPFPFSLPAKVLSRLLREW